MQLLLKNIDLLNLLAELKGLILNELLSLLELGLLELVLDVRVVILLLKCTQRLLVHSFPFHTNNLKIAKFLHKPSNLSL